MYFKLNPKSLMQYSLSEKMSFVKDMVAGGMLSRNEGRTEFDYSPADKDGMNDYNVLENYIPVDRLGDQKKLKGEEAREEQVKTIKKREAVAKRETLKKRLEEIKC